MKEKKENKKPLIYYYFITLLIVMLLNSFVFPYILKDNVTEVDYGTFLTEIEKGNVTKVQIDENEIAFETKDSEGKEKIYVTLNKEEEKKLTHSIQVIKDAINNIK